MTIECQHGNLARVCELCEKDTEIMRLKSLIAQCKEALERIQGETYADQPRMDVIDSVSFDTLTTIEKEGLYD